MNQGTVIWLTGYRLAGKSPISKGLMEAFKTMNIPSEGVDGDIVREYLSKELSWSKEDRTRMFCE